MKEMKSENSAEVMPETINKNQEEPTSFEGAIQRKLANAQESALHAYEVEEILAKFLEIQNLYHKGKIKNNERYEQSKPMIDALLPHTARFQTIGEYSAAFSELVEEGWLSRKDADDILAHENDHALPVLQHPTGDVEYILIFMKNVENIVNAFYPFIYVKFEASTEEESKKIAFDSVNAPEDLSPNDLAALKGVK